MLVPVHVLSTFCFLWSIFQLCSVFLTLMSTFCLRLVFAQSMFCLLFVLRSVFVRLILCCHLPSETISHCLFQDSAQNRPLQLYPARPLVVSNTPVTFFHGQFRIVEKEGRVFESFILEIHIFGFSRNSVSASIAILIVQHMSKTFH